MSNNNNTESAHAETPEYLPPHAVSVYGNGDALDDFPVLKAFQQYIDAEHAKSRKRLLAMAVFFGTFTLVVVAIFVVLLINVSNRNQQLNDRLVEFAMKDRASGSAVVVQSPAPQDSATVLALTTKLEEMNRKIAEAQSKADKAVAEAEAKAKAATAAAEASKPKPPTAEELEIQRLKSQLAAEKEKAAAEKARQREAELEAYRRKHYPELYAPKPQQQPALQMQTPQQQQPAVPAQPTATTTPVAAKKPAATAPRQNTLDEINDLLDDLDDLEDLDEDLDDKDNESDSGELAPISYFDDARTANADAPKKSSASKKSAKKSAKPAYAAPAKTKAKKPAKSPSSTKSDSVTISDGDSSLDWGIPD